MVFTMDIHKDTLRYSQKTAEPTDPSTKLANAPSLIPFFELTPNNTAPFATAEGTANTDERQAGVKARREQFPYGPDIISGGLTGGLPYPDIKSSKQAEDFVNKQFADLIGEQGIIVKDIANEAAVTASRPDLPLNGGRFQKLEDFFKLYEGDWMKSIPDGPFPGTLENGEKDLLFSMERLSIQAFSIRRLRPDEKPEFAVDDETAQRVTGTTQAQLLKDSRLFYIDYRDQALQKLTEGRYAAACDAFFYIHPESGDFLPLAIRANAPDSALVYTPADDRYDWLYAKMLFNVNDMWFGQWFHVIFTHEVIDAVYLASLRTMSNSHPIFNVLSRLGLQTFAIRLSALRTLFNPGGPVDSIFAWGGDESKKFISRLFADGATTWTPHYFEPELRARGLIDSDGPALKSFPFYTDSKRIIDPIRDYMRAFVHSYYPTDASLADDVELQNWIAEASGPAQVQAFPTSLSCRDDLVEILVHYAYLVSVAHGVLNTNDLSLAQLVVPWHATAFYKPVATEKGMTEQDIIAALPDVKESIRAIQLAAAFGRPSLAGGDRALIEMFEDGLRLPRYNEETREAAKVFSGEMERFSDEVQARGFDEQGLSQGMPFVWKVLDPRVTPFYVAI
ncbi:manganese lipoxygenase [Elsinoe australis]|uniref:Manganese lipoxygenase n=1 Tax=Elsinoe australis TaxID=40998 RepID=A0A4U7B5Z1_9PEZI|nr:manganese lipoxygenase [Elsinoe australis]